IARVFPLQRRTGATIDEIGNSGRELVAAAKARADTAVLGFHRDENERQVIFPRAQGDGDRHAVGGGRYVGDFHAHPSCCRSAARRGASSPSPDLLSARSQLWPSPASSSASPGAAIIRPAVSTAFSGPLAPKRTMNATSTATRAALPTESACSGVPAFAVPETWMAARPIAGAATAASRP